MDYCIILGRSRRPPHQLRARLLALALVPLLMLAWAGHLAPRPDALMPTPMVWSCQAVLRQRSQRPARLVQRSWAWAYACQSLPRRLFQAGFLGTLVGRTTASPWLYGLVCLPLLGWLLDSTAVAWPRWGQSCPCRVARQTLASLYMLALLGLGMTILGSWLGGPTLLPATLLPGHRRPKPHVIGRILADGTYEVVLGDQFVIRHKPVDEFDRRLFLLSLRDIHLVERPSKWPFVCQVWLATWFDTLQELISRWEDYRAAGDWQRLMSRRDGPLIPLEQQQAIIQVWARHLWWSVEEVTTHLVAQGMDVCSSRVEQIGRDSGLLLVRRVLRERFQIGPALLHPHDDWLVQRLFALLDQFHARLAAGERLTSQEELDLADVQALRAEIGLGLGRELTKPLPWGYRLQQVLCGAWEGVDDGTVHCPHCGSEQVRRKSRKPRTKR